VANSTVPVAAPESNGSSTETVNSQPARGPAWLLIALAVGCGWLLLLAVLALWTANPATLNRQQILQSEAIVEVEILDPAAGQVEIEGVLRQRPAASLKAGEEIRVPLHGDHWEVGEHRFLPLIHTENGEWSVTPTALPKTPLLDYPADAELKQDILDVSAPASRTLTLPR